MNRIPEEEIMTDPQDIKSYEIMSKKYLVKSHEKVISLLMKTKIPLEKILDVGTGSGWLAIMIAEKIPSCKIVGIDLSEQMLALASEKLSRFHLSRIEFIKNDASNISFPDNFFDAAVSYGSLHHWATPGKIFEELYRVISHNGYIVIADLKRTIKNLLFSKTIPDDRFKKLFISSIYAAYTAGEIKQILQNCKIKGEIKVLENGMNLIIIWKVMK